MTSKRRQRTESRAREAERYAALDELTFTAALLYFRMRKAAEEMLGEGARSSGRRSVLRSLVASGPQTVPQMARLRAVSRQHVQQLVNGLVEDGLVELVRNPAHKRSRLARLTAKGREVAAANARREREILPELARDVPLADLRTANRVLRRLKEAFESDRWHELVGKP